METTDLTVDQWLVTDNVQKEGKPLKVTVEEAVPSMSMKNWLKQKKSGIKTAITTASSRLHIRSTQRSLTIHKVWFVAEVSASKATTNRCIHGQDYRCHICSAMPLATKKMDRTVVQWSKLLFFYIYFIRFRGSRV